VLSFSPSIMPDIICEGLGCQNFVAERFVVAAAAGAVAAPV